MEGIDIRDLEARLSEVVQRALEGQRFIVTEQGEPVLELALLKGERKALVKLVIEGKASWNGEKPEGHQGLPRIVVRGEPVSETIIRDRR